MAEQDHGESTNGPRSTHDIAHGPGGQITPRSDSDVATEEQSAARAGRDDDDGAHPLATPSQAEGERGATDVEDELDADDPKRDADPKDG